LICGHIAHPRPDEGHPYDNRNLIATCWDMGLSLISTGVPPSVSRVVEERDAAILALLFACGLRKAEAVSLDMGDVDTATGAITVRGGKGRKDRTTYAVNGALETLQTWAEARGTVSGTFLFPIAKGGKVVPWRMNDQAVYLALWIYHSMLLSIIATRQISIEQSSAVNATSVWDTSRTTRTLPEGWRRGFGDAQRREVK
jgi:hypothetical protein